MDGDVTVYVERGQVVLCIGIPGRESLIMRCDPHVAESTARNLTRAAAQARADRARAGLS
jgi:hypothetical protein